MNKIELTYFLRPKLCVTLGALMCLLSAKNHAQDMQKPIVKKDAEVTEFFRRQRGCIAGDGGFTVPLSTGKVLWLMGDSHIDVYDTTTGTVPCLFQVRNTALLQPKNNWNQQNTETLTGDYTGIRSYLKNYSADSLFCWPGAGIELNNSVYIYCSSLKNQGSGAFGFAAAGNDFWAKVDVNDVSNKEYIPLPSFEGISFGVGLIKKGEWVYAYGQRYEAAAMTAILYLARFKAASPAGQWQFWNGKGWTNNVKDASAIASQPGVSGTFHVSLVNNKPLLLSSELSINCDSGTEMYFARAEKLEGPFTPKKMFYRIDDRKNGHSPFFYAVIAHPEYINANNELLVTYAINGYGTCVEDCVNSRMDPDVYRLKGLRVPVKIFN